MVLLSEIVMKKNKLDKISLLREAFEKSINSMEPMLCKDIFAIGCYLCIANQKTAGMKLLRELKSELTTLKDKRLLQSFIDTMEGNEREYGKGIWPHVEIGLCLN